MEKYYKIGETELKDLLYAWFKLDCLECNGVDNWLGYMDNVTEYIADDFNISYDEVLDKHLSLQDLVDKHLKEDDYEEVQ